MKPLVFLLVCISFGPGVAAQTSRVSMNLVTAFQVGVGPDKIEFSVGPYDGDSPASLAFAAGNLLWIGALRDAKLIDIHAKRIIQVVPYPKEDPVRRIRNGILHVFTSENLHLINGDNVVRYRVRRDPLTVGPPAVYKRSQIESSLYVIRDYAFFHDSDGLALAVDPQGAVLTNTATVALLRDWLRTTWYQTPTDRDFHSKMIEMGKYVIADGVFYPASGNQAYEYFELKGLHWDLGTVVGGRYELPSAPIGMAANGDMYIGWGDIFVVGQDGVTKATINVDSVNLARSDPRYSPDKDEYNDLGGTLYAVHPNGDLYSLYAIKNQTARVDRAVKTWGNDLVSMARSGVVAGKEATIRQQLQGFSSIELRLLRNALLALHGNVFQSYDLATYFKGFEWYAPHPNVKNDPGILTADQKRLFDIVAGIERQRVVTP